ncbi:glutamic acid-rich protein [Impatiens glandulifera]|uniref:glutamic acid-rich protein n=1 Tax=Impatiens glandulifera TaxID=253017 RepID=UPI001FB0D546|nr:glutamic acid-rich protein [Impatiens glandulifera]
MILNASSISNGGLALPCKTHLLPLSLRFIEPHTISVKKPTISIKASAADHARLGPEIDMVKNREGLYTSKKNKVVVLWDLDNKPPRGPPYDAAIALKRVAKMFGEVIEVSAYANRHAFIHLPRWVVDERRERRHLDSLERKGTITPSDPYVCGVCGRKFNTNLDLKKHFRQLHERERQKKLNRLKSLKGKKRQRYKERFVDGNIKYNDAARSLVTPKVGYGLEAELRRAGVYVKTVEDKPQAADWALKRQMIHSMSRGIDWMFLVSDDSDFSDMLRKARESNLGTVVVGDMDRALGRHADVWVPWNRVENGEVLEKDLRPRMNIDEMENDSFSNQGVYANNRDVDRVVDDLVAGRTDFHSLEMNSYYHEDDEEESEMEEDDEDDDDDDDFLLDSEDEGDIYY